MTMLTAGSLIFCLLFGLWLGVEARRWRRRRSEVGLDAYPDVRFYRRVASALLLLVALIAMNAHEAFREQLGPGAELALLGGGLISALIALYVLVHDLRETRRTTERILQEMGRNTDEAMTAAMEMELEKMKRRQEARARSESNPPEPEERS